MGRINFDLPYVSKIPIIIWLRMWIRMNTWMSIWIRMWMRIRPKLFSVRPRVVLATHVDVKEHLDENEGVEENMDENVDEDPKQLSVGDVGMLVTHGSTERRHQGLSSVVTTTTSALVCSPTVSRRSLHFSQRILLLLAIL